MERLSRLGFFSGLVVGGLVVGVIWLGESGALNTASGSLSVGYNDIASIHLQPVPEGPTSPSFVPNPRLIDQQPLALIRGLVPDPLPRPLGQPINCPGGGDLIITLKSGHELTYGPCRYPWQISQLWGAMIEVFHLTQANATPNTPAAAAEQERMRQALAVAIERHPSRRKAPHTPSMISCQPAQTSHTGQPFGYRCVVLLNSHTSANRIKLVVCAQLSGGRLTYQAAPADGACRWNS